MAYLDYNGLQRFKANLDAQTNGLIAPVYDSTKTYDVGDYVIYNNDLYRCISAITTAEAWTAAHWTQVVLADDVSELKSAFVNNKKGILNPFDMVANSYVATNGTITPYVGWKRTNYTYIGDCVSLVAKTSVSSQYNCFYNAEKTFISKFTVGTSDTNIAVPSNAVYVIFSNTNAGMDNLTVSFTTKEQNDIQKLKTTTEEIDGLRYLQIDESSFVDGKYIYEDGKTYTNSNYKVSPFLRCAYGRIKFNCLTSGSGFLSIAFYSSSEENSFISGYENTASLSTFPTHEMDVPSNANYIRISKYKFSAYTGNVSPYVLSKDSAESIAERIDAAQATADEASRDIDIINGIISSGAIDVSKHCVSTGNVLDMRRILPTYYTSYVAEPQDFNDGAYIDDKTMILPSEKSFIFLTDVHWPSNAKKSNELINYIRNKMGIRTVIHGGDVLDFNKGNKYKAANVFKEWIDEARAAFGEDLLPVQGNHDLNTAGISSVGTEWLASSIIPYTIVQKMSFGGYENTIVQESDAEISQKINGITFESNDDMDEMIAYYKMHYYKDDHSNKIRYIVVDQGNTYNGVVYKYLGVSQPNELYTQFDWLYSTLMSTPKDYSIVLSSHVIINWNTNTVVGTCLKMVSLLSALKTKASVTINHGLGSVALINAVYDNGDHVYNFASAPDVGKILCVCGDAHWDYACICRNDSGTYKSVQYSDSLAQQNDDILVIMTQTDAYGCTYPNGTYLTDTWPMTIDTVTEQCFDVVSISDSQVICTRFGAGEDREFNY